MLNYKRLVIMAGIVLAFLVVLYFIIKKEFALGMIAGFLMGAVSFSSIVFTVKSILRNPDENHTGRALLVVLVYFLKIFVIGALLALIIIFRKHFNLMGFLGGFTISLLILLAENGIVLFVLKPKN